jgi:hypothetical protein
MAALTALVLLGGCGASRAVPLDREAVLLTGTSPRSSYCTVEGRPRELPGADIVVDSARLVRSVAELVGSDPPATGHVLLTLAFDADGLNSRREVIEQAARPLLADSVQKLVFAALRQVEETEEEWGVRLRIELTDPVELRVGRREFCPPTSRNPQIEDAMRRTIPLGIRYRGGRRERVVPVRVLVGPAGTVRDAQVTRGVLHGSTVERAIADHMRQFLFEPATLDGFPVAAWVEIPIRVAA